MSMRLLALLALIPLAACGSSQRNAASRQSQDSIASQALQPARSPCGSAVPCGEWSIHTPAFDRGDEPARFAGSFRTVGSQVFVWLDTASRGAWRPADSVIAELRSGEHLETSCGLRGGTLDGRVVAVVRDTTADRYATPRRAWRFDLDARRVRLVSSDSVYCDREYAGE